jgi:hypothetical protein
MRGRQSAPRALGVECQELLSESHVLENEVLTGKECGDDPADELSEQCNHGKNRNRRVPIACRQVVDFVSARCFDEGQR